MLRDGDWSAAVARGPTPEDKGRVQMLHNLLRRTMTVPLGIFEQFTKLMVRQPFPDHRHRRRWQMPIGSSRRHVQAREIVALMTGAAFDGVYALPVWSTTDLHCVSMAIISLSRKISLGMTIDTARMAEHRHNRFESSSGAGIIAHSFMNELCCGIFHSGHGNP